MEFNDDQTFAQCPICHDEMVYDTTQLTCGHFFHNRCIKNWFEYVQQQALTGNFLCPVCKQEVEWIPTTYQIKYDPYDYIFDPEMKIDFPEYSRPISSFEPQEYSMEPPYFEPQIQLPSFAWQPFSEVEEKSMEPRYFESYFSKEFFKPDRSNYSSQNRIKEYSKNYYQKNREKILEKKSQYHSQNKEYYAEKIQCDHCGAWISRGNLPKHKKTQSCRSM